MPFTYEKILNWHFEEVVQSYSAKESILYALGVGFGQDPMDLRQLSYVFEETNFQAVPTMSCVLSSPGFWSRDPETGIDWKQILHGEQGIVIHKPLPPAATIASTTRVIDVLDKGAGKGALIFTERDLTDTTTGQKYATLTSTIIARGNGGYGGPIRPHPEPHDIPDREPDQFWDFRTIPQAALLYRLSGDHNPLHADPAVATSAGFKAPILHGLCTLGVAGHAILRCCCDYDASRFKSLKLRFTAPVYPGETLRTYIWTEGNQLSFQTKAIERDVVVLNNGLAKVTT